MQPVQLWFKNDEIDEMEMEKRRKSSVAEAFHNRLPERKKSEVPELSRMYNLRRVL
jgi:hypothetical protein